ncbi:MAG: GerMN domain-containing protein, partial [Lachnospiraceae bacterium]|nr:GerMN domain-containing protein [Lachnospiraceae bacterium]
KESVVNNAYTKNGICYVDFNEKINDKGFVGVKADTMLYAVVNSLSELNNVTGVKISINGKDDVLFRGEIGIEGIFHMNLDIIE